MREPAQIVPLPTPKPILDELTRLLVCVYPRQPDILGTHVLGASGNSANCVAKLLGPDVGSPHLRNQYGQRVQIETEPLVALLCRSTQYSPGPCHRIEYERSWWERGKFLQRYICCHAGRKWMYWFSNTDGPAHDPNTSKWPLIVRSPFASLRSLRRTRPRTTASRTADSRCSGLTSRFLATSSMVLSGVVTLNSFHSSTSPPVRSCLCSTTPFRGRFRKPLGTLRCTFSGIRSERAWSLSAVSWETTACGLPSLSRLQRYRRTRSSFSPSGYRWSLKRPCPTWVQCPRSRW